MKVSKISFNKIKSLNKYGETYKNYPLYKLTTFKIGGEAKCYLKICTLENFIKVMMYLNERKFPFFILGNGSNVLASSRGYEGVVIRLAGDFDRILARDDRMECGAGVSLGKAYLYARNLSLSGFECGVGIPATIGGATYMNAQAYDFEMAKIVEYVVAYNQDKIVYLKNEDCKFGYRDSIFQHENWIILRVGFKLERKSQEDIINAHNDALEKRKASQPLGYPNAGCIFKRQDNICVSRMLDEMGAKDYIVGGARVSSKHANFIINYDHATSEDILNLIKKIKDAFFERYNTKLETEIKFLGEFNEADR